MLAPKLRQQIIDCARTWLGVKWRHQGRTRAHGVDCIGLCIMVATELGLSYEDMYGYTRGTQGQKFTRAILRHTTRKPLLSVLPGDIVLMRDSIMPCHAAILVDNDTIIHSSAHIRMVAEERIDMYRDKLTHCLEFRRSTLLALKLECI